PACPLMALSRHRCRRRVMSALGGKADIHWCALQCPLMTQSRHIMLKLLQGISVAQNRQFDRSQARSTAMKSMLASMAVVLTLCTAPAAAAEFPKTGSAEYDTYYVDNVVAQIDSGA